ncbi:death domain-containing protein CRADD [Syngnathus acus]|uniref:death domain-containing protein CRADD n=1 Tax=Syngnathus acus TaxID=161584 RepID=UPI0018863201|nr:death domain-containing protein CRADD [Syngnathus acus]XP_037099063.1 death domain-containing protein CRADD [Syngnathus acus]
MDPVHKEVLQKLRVDLSEQLLVSDGVLLPFLYQEDILTAAQVEDILAESSERKRCLRLLDVLPKRGPKAFACFLRALDDFAWLRDRLLQELDVRTGTAPHEAPTNRLETTEGFPEEVARRVPSERHLSGLATALGGEWEAVAMDLGVSSAALFRCRADHALSCHDAALAALLLWRRSQGKNATARRLQQSLRAAGVHSSVLRDIMMS